MCMVSDVCTEVEMSKTGPTSRFGLSAALLRTCRAVYNEAIPELYGSKVFKASMFIDFNIGLRTFSRLARRCIKTIRIDIESCLVMEGEDAYYTLANDYFRGNLDEALLSRMPSLTRVDVHCDMAWFRYGLSTASPIQTLPMHEQFLKSLEGTEPIHGRDLDVLMQRLKQRGGRQLRLDLCSRELDISAGFKCVQESRVVVELELEQYKSGADTTRTERWVVKKISENLSPRATP